MYYAFLIMYYAFYLLYSIIWEGTGLWDRPGRSRCNLVPRDEGCVDMIRTDSTILVVVQIATTDPDALNI